MENTIIEALFATNAIRVAPESQPFWYTSGRLGPFFINTHFLLENEAAAGEVLKRIEKAISDNKLTAPEEIFDLYNLVKRAIPSKTSKPLKHKEKRRFSASPSW